MVTEASEPVLVLFGSCIAAGLTVGAVVALVNSWLP